MRDMTEQEKDLFYSRNLMPCGCGTEFYQGPRGGLMRNIECVKCGLELNVLDTETAGIFTGYGKASVRQLGIGQVLREPKGYKPYVPPSVFDRVRTNLSIFFGVKA